MDVVILLVFVSLVLVVGALLFFISRLKDGDFEHGERLSLLPLDEEETSGVSTHRTRDSHSDSHSETRNRDKEDSSPHGSHT